MNIFILFLKNDVAVVMSTAVSLRCRLSITVRLSHGLNQFVKKSWDSACLPGKPRTVSVIFETATL